MGLADHNIDPAVLIHLLTRAGWNVVGGRRDSYLRLTKPKADKNDPRAPSLLIPLDQTAPDYQELMDAALATLNDHYRAIAWWTVIQAQRRNEHLTTIRKMMEA